MKSIIPIIKKELKRFFTDKRLLATLLMPGIMIYILYSFMGGLFNDMLSVDEDFEFILYIDNEPTDDIYKSIIEATELNITVKEYNPDNLDVIKEEIRNEEAQLLILFPEGFEDDYSNSGLKFEIEMYYNSDSIESQSIYMFYTTLLQELEKDFIQYEPMYSVNGGEGDYNLSAKDQSMNPMTMMIPMLLMMFLATGVVSTATESIAGEKERGTIATLLVTPVSRVKLAFSKIIAITIPSLLSATSSFLGLYLSLPKLMGFAEQEGMSISLNFGQIAALFAVVMITVLLYTVIVSIISTYAKSIKESQQLTAPLMIVSSMLGVFTIFFTNPDFYLFLIPILNSVLVISSVFDATFSMTNLLITIGSNIVFIVAGIFIVAKMFSSEKIIFNK